MNRKLPDFLVPYLPKRHRLFYATKHGATRDDWLLCVCGLGIKLEKIPGEDVDGKPTMETEPLTDERWLDAVNQCRMAMHTPRTPCLPVTLEGIEQPIREQPPVSVEPPEKRKAGRPKKEVAHAA